MKTLPLGTSGTCLLSVLKNVKVIIQIWVPILLSICEAGPEEVYDQQRDRRNIAQYLQSVTGRAE